MRWYPSHVDCLQHEEWCVGVPQNWVDCTSTTDSAGFVVYTAVEEPLELYRKVVYMVISCWNFYSSFQENSCLSNKPHAVVVPLEWPCGIALHWCLPYMANLQWCSSMYAPTLICYHNRHFPAVPGLSSCPFIFLLHLMCAFSCDKPKLFLLDSEGSLSATTIVLVLVVVTRFRIMPKALLIRNGKLRNFAHTFVTSFQTDTS